MCPKVSLLTSMALGMLEAAGGGMGSSQHLTVCEAVAAFHHS